MTTIAPEQKNTKKSVVEAVPTPPSINPSVQGCFKSLETEYSYWVDDIEGVIPKDLEGTFLRNGPGRLDLGGESIGHWFDGDGMIAATTFTNGKAHFKNRYIRTQKYIDETEQGYYSYRGMGTLYPGGPLKNIFRKPGNLANTSLVWHGNKLLALWEGGKPHEIDPMFLSTKGIYDYDKGLKLGDAFSAHGKVNAKTGQYINFGITATGIGLNGPKFGLNIFKISPNGHLVQRAVVDVDRFCFCHDFAMTENYAIFFVSSIVYKDAFSALIGTKAMKECLDFDARLPAGVVVVDLNTLLPVERFELEPSAIVHFSNSFERKDELIIDGMKFTDFEVNKQLSNVHREDFKLTLGAYTRYRINLRKGKIREEAISDKAVGCEFPQWDQRFTGQETTMTFAGASTNNGYDGFFNSIQKVDFKRDKVDIHQFDPGQYNGEPFFVPKNQKAKEGEGYLLSYVYDANVDKSHVVVLDAKDISKQYAKINFKHHIPQGFHGWYIPEVFLA